MSFQFYKLRPQLPKKYWCVWRWNGGAPTKGHNTFEEARREAERLALENPGEFFTVFEAVGRAFVTTPVTWEDFHG